MSGHRRSRQEHGTMTVLLASVSLVMAILVAVATVEGAVLLREARTAEVAADAAALAAVTAMQPGSTQTPRGAADGVAAAHGATVESCRCSHSPVEVRVLMPVDRRLLGLLGITEVQAIGRARLVEARSGPRPVAGMPALWPLSGRVASMRPGHRPFLPQRWWSVSTHARET